MGAIGTGRGLPHMVEIDKAASSTRDLTSSLLRLSAFGVLFIAGFTLLLVVDFNFNELDALVKGTSPLVFIVLMCILPLLGFPIALFYLFAGTAFPWWQATIFCSLSLAINIAIAYPLSQKLLAVPLAHVLARFRKKLPLLTEENQFRVTFLVRSIPGVPFCMQNYLLPLLGVHFAPYLLISWSIQTAFAAGMTAIPQLVANAGWIPALIVLVLLILLGLFHRLYIGKRLDQ